MSTERLAAVLQRFSPLLDEIARGAYDREQRHELPHAQVRQLVGAGITALRVSVQRGGDGLTWPEFAAFLVELAAADSALPQVFRGHFAIVEDVLTWPESDDKERWLRRFVDGEVVGNAWSEVGSGRLGRSHTELSRTSSGALVLNGSKYYTTGTIFADWADVTAYDVDNEREVTVLVRTRNVGVVVSDDWTGFGQQLTGTGTATFTDAPVDELDVKPSSERFRYQTALYQIVLLTVLAGIARSVERESAAAVRGRDRQYSHGNASRVKDDPQILAVVGEIAAISAAADAVVQQVAHALQAAFETASDRDSEADRAANIEAELASARGQVVLSKLVPEAATRLFDTLGASGVSTVTGFDRHWRNARTVASHNPWLFKARIIGDWHVNGTEPPFVWSIGVAQADQKVGERS